ncbi:MAG: glycosyltransferase [Sarcina sp.]
MVKIIFGNKKLEEKLLETLRKGYENISEEDKEYLRREVIKEYYGLFEALYENSKKEHSSNVLTGETREIYNELVKIINNIYSDEIERVEKIAFKKEIEKILNEEDFDEVIIFHASFGWNIELKQRPQHLAEALSNERILYIYKTHEKQENIFSFEKIKSNLYIMNLENRILRDVLFSELALRKTLKKFIHVYATCLYDVTYEMIIEYEKLGFKVLYDFVDELSEAISYREITENIKEAHRVLLKDKENVMVISTADRLKKIADEVRGNNKGSILAPNGVNLSDFNVGVKSETGIKIKSIVEKKKPIIGYYGALASWFDYRLIRELAIKKPEYEIVLIGINYDGSLEKSGILEIKNIHYLGIIEYKELIEKYAVHFDVSLIPFIKNEITNSTSPIKLFEYMALRKPIVTTDIEECKKYKSSIVSYSNEEFIENVDKALEMKNNNGYFKLLEKEALENTWESRAKVIKRELNKFE